MNITESIKMPVYNEYFLVLNPNEDLCSRIVKVKREFYNSYKAPSALWWKPHITLARFYQRESLEERIGNSLKIVAMGHQPFKVELKNFGSFPSHSIFINVETQQTIKSLVKEIKAVQRLLKPDKDHKPHFIETPALMMACKLLPWQYNQGWLEYSKKHFTGRFIADSMLLLKKREGRSLQIVQRFEFMNLPVSIKQGELFGSS